MINTPTTSADDYFVEDSADIAPKHGTSVQSGWDLAAAVLDKTASSGYPTDFKFTETNQLVRFLEDDPFDVYAQHWIEREGKKSFVCLQTPRIDESCPICDIAGDQPRNKFTFNVVVLTDENDGTPKVQILTAPPSFARQLRAMNMDPIMGPLTKHYWAISRHGSGTKTLYTLNRVKATDLAEEWDLDPEVTERSLQNLPLYDSSVTYVTPREELLEIARSLVS
jgi:hypothetical protein